MSIYNSYNYIYNINHVPIFSIHGMLNVARVGSSGRCIIPWNPADVLPEDRGLLWSLCSELLPGNLGRSGKDLGRIWEGSGKIWEDLGRSGKDLGRSGKDLGRIWEGSGKDLGRTWEGPGTDLGRTWEGPGKDLGRIWEGSGKDLGRMGRILGEFQLFVLVSRKHLLPGMVMKFMKFMKLRILPVLPQHFTAWLRRRCASWGNNETDPW